MAKNLRDIWDECRATRKRKARTLTYEDWSVLLLELALKKESDQHLNAYRHRVQGGEQGHGPHHGPHHRNARYMSTLFGCEAIDEQGALVPSGMW